MATNVVNLDALIRRADMAEPGEAGSDISSLSLTGLAPKGLLYPALRKPDFQRETANWSPEQVADLVITFANGDLIPAVILWRSGQYVFVIDGAHRLSALIAWAHDDYGDGEVSRKFFQNTIPDEQYAAAQKTRSLINQQIGSFVEHQIAIEYPNQAKPGVRERAARIGWQEIYVQWIRNADYTRAEKSFFRINQGGTAIDPVEARILKARGSATALAARAILRGGKGHNYWDKFAPEVQDKIEELGGAVWELLFEPPLALPIKTLDVPLAGQGYGPRVLPFVFDLVNLVNDLPIADSSKKHSIKGDVGVSNDPDGRETIKYLTNVRSMLERICSVHPSSLGLHPAVYFYSRRGVFQPQALLSFIAFFKAFKTDDYKQFTTIRRKFEEFLIANRGVSEVVHTLGSGARSRPRMVSLYRKLQAEFSNGASIDEVERKLAHDPDFSFLFGGDDSPSRAKGTKFKRDTKGAAFLRDALPNASRCQTCGGLLHRNGIQTGHLIARREGGTGSLDNAILQHPFCNSTVAN